MRIICKYLLGDFDQSVDMWELNRETPQIPPPAARPGLQQQQQQQGRRRGPEEN